MKDLLLLFMLPLTGGLAAWGLRIETRHFKVLLAFSGAFILGLSFFHILPMSYKAVGMHTGTLIIAGFMLQVLLEVMTKGLEHGHAHHLDSQRLPIALFIGLALHSFVEGMPFGHSHDHGHGEDALLIGVLIHKLPEAFILGTVLRGSGLALTRALPFLIGFACMSPLGGIVSGLVEHRFEDPGTYFGVVMALVVGIFLHVATTIIYETDKSHKFNLGKMAAIISGFAAAYLSLSAAH